MAGIDQPDWLRGKSLVPLASGKSEPLHEKVFATVNYHAAYEPQRAVRTTRYKYIRRWNLQTHPVLPNCDDSVSKRELLRAGWRERPQREEVLYDLVFDPNEACDVSKDTRYADALTEMRTALAEWMKRTNDPLLNGVVPAPPDLRVNPVDGDSPQRNPA
jgi:arylsulfatase A-like enzyme